MTWRGLPFQSRKLPATGYLAECGATTFLLYVRRPLSPRLALPHLTMPRQSLKMITLKISRNQHGVVSFDSWCSCVIIVLLQTSSFRNPKPFFATCKSVNIKYVAGCLWIYNQAYVSFPVVPRLGTQFMVNSNISPTNTKPKTDVSTYTKYRISSCQVCYASPHAPTASALTLPRCDLPTSIQTLPANLRPPHRLQLRSFQNLPASKYISHHHVAVSCPKPSPQLLQDLPRHHVVHRSLGGSFVELRIKGLPYGLAVWRGNENSKLDCADWICNASSGMLGLIMSRSILRSHCQILKQTPTSTQRCEDGASILWKPKDTNLAVGPISDSQHGWGNFWENYIVK